MATKTSILRDEAMALAARFRAGWRSEVATTLAQASEDVRSQGDCAAAAFLVAAVADALDPGQRADLLSELRQPVRR